MTVINEWYSELKGESRQIQGELFIEGFEESDYITLFDGIIEDILPYIGFNYDFWYVKWARSYHKKFMRDRHNPGAYCPQVEKPLDAQTVREQLVTIKHFLMTRNYSRYKPKVEERK